MCHMSIGNDEVCIERPESKDEVPTASTGTKGQNLFSSGSVALKIVSFVLEGVTLYPAGPGGAEIIIFVQCTTTPF
jgi:hypothetical protein